MAGNPHILVAYKKSRYEQYVLDQGDQAVAHLIDEGHVSVARLRASHLAHQQSLDTVLQHLSAQGLSFEACYRGEVQDVSRFDLVVAAGGDGTVLDLSHRIDDTPMLAINSDPAASVGYFCAGYASEFAHLLEKTLEARWQPTRLRRFYVCLDGERRGPPVLNDVLISHANPAAVSTYLLKVGNHPPEGQKSSGIWFSTPAGSTAAIRSAGGYVLPFRSNNFQYLVREPYPPRQGGYRFLKGIVPVQEAFEVVSRMREGRIFLDGPHLALEFGVGATLTIDDNAPSLALYGLEEDRRTA
ncbi:hypothetical protein DL240_12770 [Lujinxingia litoralis]|uniref:NAD(+) kinase n=1 Tax=Lujinxingia litoralis TaxID=2211119 RepID=A0A328C5Z5_9DELT|nr:NAD(+)/NADH kinase [Lujinxingia litoralis]RAL21721.1 hypothetical protein DL240_12770 [Lujinxingia litoralis]